MRASAAARFMAMCASLRSSSRTPWIGGYTRSTSCRSGRRSVRPKRSWRMRIWWPTSTSLKKFAKAPGICCATRLHGESCIVLLYAATHALRTASGLWTPGELDASYRKSSQAASSPAPKSYASCLASRRCGAAHVSPSKCAVSCGIVQALQKHYQRLLGSVPARRLNPAALLESTMFANKLVRFGVRPPGCVH